MFKKIAIASVIIVLIVIGLILNIRNQKSNKDHHIISEENTEEIASFDITVQIVGEVNKPGIYETSSDSRVYDLVILAGGFTDKADKSLNQVQKLKDGMIITVKKAEQLTKDSKVSINSGSLQELTTLPSVGSTLATEIITYRQNNGPFNRLNDLSLVKGVSDKTLIALLPYIKL